jgi:hypothetical protein
MGYNSKYKSSRIEELLDKTSELNIVAVETGAEVATRKIKDAKDLATNELIYFKGHAKATYMSDGRNLEEAIHQISTGGGGGITAETDPVFSASPAASITEEKIAEWNSKSAQGDKGDTGVGVQSVVQTTTSNDDDGSNIVTVTLTDGTTSTFSVKNGSKGSNGKDGADGEDGATFTPSVDSAGNLSWSNNKGLTNPPTVNIKGPKGDAGEAGGSSGGSGVYAEVNYGTSDTTFTLTPNTFHVWDEVSLLTLTLGTETIGVANEYLFQFTSGSTATTLSLPDDIKWTGGETPTIEANKIYQISILKGLGSVLEWDNTGEMTFTVNNTPYQYLSGMSWSEFINSNYNPAIYTQKMFIVGDYGPSYALNVYAEDDIEYSSIMTEDYSYIDITDNIQPINYISE